MSSQSPQHPENKAVPRVLSEHDTAQQPSKAPRWVRQQIDAMRFTDIRGNTWWDTKAVALRVLVILPVVFGALMLGLGGLMFATASLGQDEDSQDVAETLAEREAKADVVEGRFQQVYRDRLEDQLEVSAEQIDADLMQARQDVAQALSLVHGGSSNPTSSDLEVDPPEGMDDAAQVIGDWEDWHIVSHPDHDHRYAVLVEYVELSDDAASQFDEMLAQHNIYDLNPIELGSEVLHDQELRSLMDQQTDQRWTLMAEFTSTVPGDISWVRASWMEGSAQVALHDEHRVVEESADVPEDETQHNSVRDYTTEHDDETTEG